MDRRFLRPGKRRFLNQSGFSLTDVMSALGLTAVLSGLTLPFTSELLASYRMASSIEQLTHEIAGVRMQAVGQNTMVRMRFINEHSYIVETSADAENYETWSGPVPLPSGVSVVNDNAVSFEFNRRGLANSQVVTALTNSVGTKILQTNPLGRTTVLN